MDFKLVFPLILIIAISACVQYGPTAPTIAVNDQSLENDQVKVASFFLDKPGYVVIHADVDGKPGTVIGNSELVSGSYSNFKVIIDATQAGTRVFAMLHYDDGDGQYEFPGDDTPVKVEDQIVVKPINLVPAAAEEISITSVQAPASVAADSSFAVSWAITGPEKAIPHTAVHYDTASHPGDFSLDVAPGDSGYPSLTPEFASGEFNIPNTFTVSMQAPESEVLYYRVHAIIDGNNYWTSERMITVTTTAPAAPTNTIEITSAGFSPSALTISSGETVTFVNKDTTSHWPASNVHPIHTLYPETGGCIGSKFDACKGLAQDEMFSFTFNQVGTWNYHDHTSPGSTGTITVV